MHVLMFGDQHVESLGGAQVSMRLQRRFLERAGHTVTIVAPKMHGPRAGVGDEAPALSERQRDEAPALSERQRDEAPALSERQRDEAYVDTPSIPITFDREYSLSWPGRRTDRFVDQALTGRPPVDVVHVQADFWGAFTGHRYAARHGLPVVHTMHNRVDVGIEATAPFPGLVLRVLNAWQRRALRSRDQALPGGRDGWSYLRRFAGRSNAVTAPSSHFARRLEEHGVVPGADGAVPGVDVVWNGIDDDVLDKALAAGAAERAPGRPRFVWLGRMSPEKRLLPFLEAVAESGIDADVEIIGGGGQERAARRLVRKLTPGSIRRLLGQDAVRRDAPAHRCGRRGRADLDRLRDAGHDRLRGRVTGYAGDRLRPRYRCRARLGLLAGHGCLDLRSGGGAADGGRGDHGRHGREARSVRPRALPPVVAHGGDGGGLRPRPGLTAAPFRGAAGQGRRAGLVGTRW